MDIDDLYSWDNYFGIEEKAGCQYDFEYVSNLQEFGKYLWNNI